MVPSLAIIIFLRGLSGAMADSHDPRRPHPSHHVERSNGSATYADTREKCDPNEGCPSLEWSPELSPFQMCTNDSTVNPDKNSSVSKRDCEHLANIVRAREGYWKASGFTKDSGFNTFWSSETCGVAISSSDGPDAIFNIGNEDVAGFLDLAIQASQDSQTPTVTGKSLCSGPGNGSSNIQWMVGHSPGTTPSPATTILPLGIFAICMIALWFSVTWPFSA
ncbi:hypothetical protein F5X96DRAFT_90908 [Biscogniauxia mediterranea]|nr:hypothetical protein F5X96DRAFT_90908 [Biscogniauxia mediterranea]